MKVEQTKKAFVPVTITLETEKEVLGLYRNINICDDWSLDGTDLGGNITHKEVSNIGQRLVDKLEDIVEDIQEDLDYEKSVNLITIPLWVWKKHLEEKHSPR